MKHQTVPAVVEALLEGRARIESGWCRGVFMIDVPGCLGGPKYCAIGALSSGFDNSAETWRAGNFLQNALPKGWETVSVYNDTITTTKADILALYDRAIEIALAQ